MIEIREADLKIEYYRGSGPGGQHRNVTETCVRIRHLPTGIVVQACENRSQARNRELALERLRQALARRARRAKKRVATTVPRSQKEKRIEEKKRRSLTKRLRTPLED
ncbi:peptide chain release factor-like protein [Geobacter hydrogenophilus]|uniref:Hydrolase n=1 Tax=Geobacter hydrogenophilus TaxID=40983 RepID=A0A9W6G126_9BACT|nr:peptide chain release factor-like protein [Geobacter hydrogenophilus]MBT0893283.1 peptide chain release factor-like protein [Geobacter hydrogenophilus]GLI38870.1 hydrolase [Geobacter hydrogenophilus]